MSAARPMAESDLARFAEDAGRLRAALATAVVGQDALVADVAVAILAGGHVLLEGLPGLGKTRLAKTAAHALDVALARIQCTPDLMPADITGSEVLVQDPQGATQALEFRRGPVFSSMVLVDEINRASPKTQAALLEAMQEGQITYGGVTHALPVPFWVLATQNPIELEGTYPLPEAQLDRFLCKLLVPYPDRDALARMLDLPLEGGPAPDAGPGAARVLSRARVLEMMAQAREVVLAPPLRDAAVALVLATRPEGDEAARAARDHVRYGASPRGLQALLRAARVRALAAGRGHVALADVRASALPALRHRVLLRVESELDAVDVDSVLAEILEEWAQRSGAGRG